MTQKRVFAAAPGALPIATDVREFPRPPAWTEEAACATVLPDLFFSTAAESIAAAKDVCASCPVATKCLDDVLANPDEWGIRAGLTPTERRRLGQDGAA